MLLQVLLHIQILQFYLHFFRLLLTNLPKLNQFIQNKILKHLDDKVNFNFNHLMLQLYQDVLKHFLYIYLYLLVNVYL